MPQPRKKPAQSEETGRLALEDDGKPDASDKEEEGDEKVTKEAKGKKKAKEEKLTKEKKDKKEEKEEKTKETKDKKKEKEEKTKETKDKKKKTEEKSKETKDKKKETEEKSKKETKEKKEHEKKPGPKAKPKPKSKGKPKEDLAFTPNDAKAFHHACCQMAHLNLHVWRHFAQEDVPPIFQVTSKMHMLQHLTENSGALNPRMTWCYSQEDFMGVVRHMAQNCAAGTPPLMAGAKLMDHWLIAFELLQ